jgi:hypothetical protein
MKWPSVFAYDKLLKLPSYFNNMRPQPIHASTNNTTSLKGWGGGRRNIGVTAAVNFAYSEMGFFIVQ